jgi:hypothetical protein
MDAWTAWNAFVWAHPVAAFGGMAVILLVGVLSGAIGLMCLFQFLSMAEEDKARQRTLERQAYQYPDVRSDAAR